MDFTKSDCGQPYSSASVGQEQRSCRLFVDLSKKVRYLTKKEEEGCSSRTTTIYLLRKYLNRQLEDFSILRKSKKSKSEKESQEKPYKVGHRHDRCVSHQVVLVPSQEIIISLQ